MRKQTPSPRETYGGEENNREENHLFPLHVCPVYVERLLQTQLTSGKEKQDDWPGVKPQTAGDQVLALGSEWAFIYLTLGPRLRPTSCRRRPGGNAEGGEFAYGHTFHDDTTCRPSRPRCPPRNC